MAALTFESCYCGNLLLQGLVFSECLSTSTSSSRGSDERERQRWDMTAAFYCLWSINLRHCLLHAPENHETFIWSFNDHLRIYSHCACHYQLVVPSISFSFFSSSLQWCVLARRWWTGDSSALQDRGVIPAQCQSVHVSRQSAGWEDFCPGSLWKPGGTSRPAHRSAAAKNVLLSLKLTSVLWILADSAKKFVFNKVFDCFTYKWKLNINVLIFLTVLYMCVCVYACLNECYMSLL